MTHRFYLVDVFAERPYCGNQLAIVVGEEALPEETMLPASGFSVRIEQGHEIGRPSLVMLRARMINRCREVSVGGSVVPTAHGELA